MSGSLTEALRQWRGREAFPTDLSSAELRGFSRELRLRSVFSAKTTSAEYVTKIMETVDRMLSGEINQATGRLSLIRELAKLGYDAETGFPADMAGLPPVERGSLQDLSSAERIDLVLETNERMAANYGLMMAGNSEYALREYPAWELVRIYERQVPRGSPESHSVGWDLRWQEAGDAVAWQGAIPMPWIALKDSPIWHALGDGEGGYTDTLGNPFPPFAFHSGLGWRSVPRREAVRLRLLKEGDVPAPMQGRLAPDQEDVANAFRRLDPALQDAIRKELAA